MNEIKEIKIPKGVESISVTHHDDKIVIEFIPEEPKKGDWAIFWDNGYHLKPLIRLYHAKSQVGRTHLDSSGTAWDNAIKWDSTKEQFEKVVRGEIN